MRKGGPGTSDPERIDWTGVTQQTILELAYEVNRYQVSGPSWLRDAHYDIQATLPSQTTKEQFRVMLQNLLKDRFNLVLHHESREMQVYDLVLAPGGPKFKESVVARDPAIAGALGTDENGHPNLPPGSHGMAGKMVDGELFAAVRTSSMVDFADDLQQGLQIPVFDKTGLTGVYDFTLDYAREVMFPNLPRASNPDPPKGPTLFKALEDQLGLKLVSKKEPLDVLVIDKTDRKPTDN